MKILKTTFRLNRAELHCADPSFPQVLQEPKRAIVSHTPQSNKKKVVARACFKSGLEWHARTLTHTVIFT